MIERRFITKASTSVTTPFEEGLMSDGKVSSNHLMYIAQKKIDDDPDSLKSYLLTYETKIREVEYDDAGKQIGFRDISIEDYNNSLA